MTSDKNKTVLALRHVAFEDLGTLADPLEQAGYHIEYVDVAVTTLDATALLAADLVVILGGPIGVGDAASYPLISTEIELIRRRLREDRPTLGICLGAQVIAAALGANVYPGPTKEIGWASLAVCEGILRKLEDQPVLHWHGDTFDLPEGCTNLASTNLCHNQAFARGNTVLALQFHIEVKSRSFEHWLMGLTHEIVQEGLDIRRLRADAQRYATMLEAKTRRIMADWLMALD
ncbi:glutamine amidotransferase [Mangrovitalea sediminis]|uniref:glutamine amidotransferase n=1 Tax=Mangrovitalea sediminis TaxID=1982043 RepID=UPI000BE4DA44|nr:glutamine amidotransferase [Mangrovitalea sediminis]